MPSRLVVVNVVVGVILSRKSSVGASGFAFPEVKGKGKTKIAAHSFFLVCWVGFENLKLKEYGGSRSEPLSFQSSDFIEGRRCCFLL